MTGRTRIVVVGNGMVGSRFVADLTARDADAEFDVTLLGEEEYHPYNRVLLSEVVAGKVDLSALALPEPDGDRVRVERGAPVIAIDRASRTVLTSSGSHHYDRVVLATGSVARIPDLPGLEGDLPAGVHALRTLDDAREIVAATANARRAVVIGAGVLGLEAACGLARRGLEVAVIHAAGTVMDRQLDADAGRVAQASLAGLGIATWTRARTRRVVVEDGRVTGIEVDAGEDPVTLAADLVVLACGTAPEVALARSAGLAVDRGVLVGADLASPDDPRIFAIGDCAQPPEGGAGLIAQGWDQARRLAGRLTRPDQGPPTAARPERPSMALRLSLNTGVVSRPAVPASTPALAAGTDVVRLKAAGLEVVTMGVSGARRRSDSAHRSVRLSDPAAGRHIEVVVADGLLVGATCVGAPDVAADLSAAYTRRTPVPADPAQLLIRPLASAAAPAATPERMPDSATVCLCNGVTKGDIVTACRAGAHTAADVARATRATTGCGSCKETVCGLLDWLGAAEGPTRPTPSGRSDAISHQARAASENNVTTGQRAGH
ncbi:FAD-dependent oxidoreductase [Occultella kanbiaonis]|uniref:FAD-dependent oxidoreductase n=1 Tax=Occultella kanbiaonis TaxID=2675754 RepID=UPI001E316C38|nr:FAD-dependent oxidoreductase [Occultella kanbiaonis]